MYQRILKMMIINRFKILGLIALFTVFSTACVNAEHTEETVSSTAISAKSDMKAGTLAILSRITDVKLEIKDTSIVDEKGSFSFDGDYGSEEGEILFITFDNTTPPGIPVILEIGASVKLNVKTNGNTYDVKWDGGKYNDQMQKLYGIYTKFEQEMEVFNANVAKIDATTVTEQIRQQTTKRYNDLLTSRSAGIEYFVKNEKGSPATYFAVKYLFEKQVPKLVSLAYDRMKVDMPESSYTTRLAAAAKQIGPTVPGALAPDINLKTPEGETLALSSLRGKVVLIDFWASWCGPCRKENPNVKKLYEKYKDKGFEIYAVSLDNNGDRWKAAIAKDGLPWKHVSDLGGWKSSAAQLYGVRSIPQTFLLDQEGRIIQTGLRSHQLDQVLYQLFQ